MTLAHNDQTLVQSIIARGFLSQEQAQYWLTMSQSQRLSLSQCLAQNQVLTPQQWQSLQAGLNSPSSGHFASIGSLTGQMLGPYQILEVLGQGGMGTVFRALDAQNNREVALKVMRRSHDSSKETLQRFYEEANTASRLASHKNLVEIYDVGQGQDLVYMAMGLIDGEELSDWLKKPNSDLDTALMLLSGVAEAVEHIHRQGVIHRDIKPQNILIDQDNEPKLMDFGIAKDEQRQESLTRTGTMMGSLNYMAPEQLEDAKAIDHRADVYSLGAVLYEILTGQPPHLAGNAVDVMASLMSRDPKRPREINPELSPTLENICLKAMHRDPEQRYQEAIDLMDDIDRFLQVGEFTDPTPLGGGSRGGALALILGVLLVCAATWIYWPKADQPTPPKNIPTDTPKPGDPPTQEPSPSVTFESEAVRFLSVRNNDWLSSRTVIIKGEVGAKVSALMLNGQKLVIKNQQFDHELSLQRGANQLGLKVRGKDDAWHTLPPLCLNVDDQFPKIRLEELSNWSGTETEIRLRGQVEDPQLKSLTVNGQAVPVKDSAFEFRTSLKRGQHEFHVQATDLAGNSSGVIRRVSTQALASLAITLPYPVKERGLTGNSNFTFHGRVHPPKATLTINGQATDTEPRTGQFSFNTSLKDGDNDFEFVATHEGKTVKVVKLMRLSKDLESPIKIKPRDLAKWLQASIHSDTNTFRFENLKPEWLAKLTLSRATLKLPKIKSLHPHCAEILASSHLEKITLPVQCLSPEAAEALVSFRGHLVLECHRKALRDQIFSVLSRRQAGLTLKNARIFPKTAKLLVNLRGQLDLQQPILQKGSRQLLLTRKEGLALTLKTFTDKNLGAALGEFRAPLRLTLSKQIKAEAIFAILQGRQSLSLGLPAAPPPFLSALLGLYKGSLSLNLPPWDNDRQELKHLEQIAKMTGPLTLSLKSCSEATARFLAKHQGGLSLPNLKSDSPAFDILKTAYFENGWGSLRLGDQTWTRLRRANTPTPPKALPIGANFGPLKSFNKQPVIVLKQGRQASLKQAQNHQLTDLNIQDRQWVNRQYWTLKARLQPQAETLYINGQAVAMAGQQLSAPLYFEQGLNEVVISIDDQGQRFQLARLQIRFDDVFPDVRMSSQVTLGSEKSSTKVRGLAKELNLKTVHYKGQRLPVNKQGQFQFTIDGRADPEVDIVRLEDYAGNVFEHSRLPSYQAFQETIRLPKLGLNGRFQTTASEWPLSGRFQRRARSVVKVNDQELELRNLKEFSIFSTSVPLKPGLNTLTLSLTRARQKAIKTVIEIERLIEPEEQLEVSQANKQAWQEYSQGLDPTALTDSLTQVPTKWASMLTVHDQLRLPKVQSMTVLAAKILAASPLDKLTLSWSLTAIEPVFKALCQFPGTLTFIDDSAQTTLPESLRAALQSRQQPLVLKLQSMDQGLAEALSQGSCPLTLSLSKADDALAALRSRKAPLHLSSAVPASLIESWQGARFSLEISGLPWSQEAYTALAKHQGLLLITVLDVESELPTLARSLKGRLAATELRQLQQLHSNAVVKDLASIVGPLTLRHLKSENLLESEAQILVNEHAGPLRFPSVQRRFYDPATLTLLKHRQSGVLRLGSSTWWKRPSPRRDSDGQ